MRYTKGWTVERSTDLGKIVKLNMLSSDEGAELDDVKKNWKCSDGIRPCPFFCRYNLQYEVTSTGSVKYKNEFEGSNCTWDYADTGEPVTIRELESIIGMDYERIRQIEIAGIQKAARLKDNVDFIPERRSIGAQCEDAAFFEQRDNPDYRG